MLLLFFNAIGNSCGKLSNPSNGLVKFLGGTTTGAKAVYSCKKGYTLTGSRARACQTNCIWSDKEPICKSNLSVKIIRS